MRDLLAILEVRRMLSQMGRDGAVDESEEGLCGAERWARQPHSHLGQKTPIEVLGLDGGLPAVRQALKITLAKLDAGTGSA